MPKSISYTLKRRNIFFKTQGELKSHLTAIYKKYKKGTKNYIDNQDDIYDLRDYLEDIHTDRHIFVQDFDLDTCKFYVAMSPLYGTECLFIEDKQNNSRQFSYKAFKAPDFHSNFSKLCCALIKEIKLEIRKSKLPEGEILENYDLYHIYPKLSEVINEFIEENQLSEIILSPNGSGYNIPKLNNGYEYIADKFIDFYNSKYSDIDKQYSLKPTKKSV